MVTGRRISCLVGMRLHVGMAVCRRSIDIDFRGPLEYVILAARLQDVSPASIPKGSVATYYITDCGGN